MPIELICIDADDTLWHNMRHFDVAERTFLSILEPFAAAGIVLDRLQTAPSPAEPTPIVRSLIESRQAIRRVLLFHPMQHPPAPKCGAKRGRRNVAVVMGHLDQS